jgi:predicted component of type VI protein secretion system
MGMGVEGQYVYPDPPLGWMWQFGSEMQGPHACSRRCWDTLGLTKDGKLRIWDSHEARAEKHAASGASAPLPDPQPVRSKMRAASSWIYFAQASEGGPVKIGTSRNPAARIRELSVASATGLRLLTQEEGGRRDELELHRRFADARMHGEWFQPVPELLEYIRARGGAI